MTTKRAHGPIESYSLKLRDGRYVDSFLYKSDKPEEGSFIKLRLFIDGERSEVHLKKDKASFPVYTITVLNSERFGVRYGRVEEKVSRSKDVACQIVS